MLGSLIEAPAVEKRYPILDSTEEATDGVTKNSQ